MLSSASHAALSAMKEPIPAHADLNARLRRAEGLNRCNSPELHGPDREGLQGLLVRISLDSAEAATTLRYTSPSPWSGTHRQFAQADPDSSRYVIGWSPHQAVIDPSTAVIHFLSARAIEQHALGCLISIAPSRALPGWRGDSIAHPRRELRAPGYSMRCHAVRVKNSRNMQPRLHRSRTRPAATAQRGLALQFGGALRAPLPPSGDKGMVVAEKLVPD